MQSLMADVAPMDFGELRKPMMGELAEDRQPGAKRHQPMQMELPLPLTEAVMAQALVELSQGTARAVQSCLECYRSKHMSASDLLSFTRSISLQSASLAVVFKVLDAQHHAQDAQDQSMGEAAGADDMAELMAMWGSASAPAPPPQPQPQPVLPCAPVVMAAPHLPSPPTQPATNPMPAIAIDAVRPPAYRLTTKRTRKAKKSEPSNEEVALMQWWSQKRLPEIARRQRETATCNQLPSEGDKNKAYVRFLMVELVRKLPPAGIAKLLEYVKGFNASSDIAAFAEQVRELVDEFNVKVMLNFPPECTVRVTPTRTVRGSAVVAAASAAPPVAAIDLDGDLDFVGDTMWPAVSAEPVPAAFNGCAKAACHASCAHDGATHGKRKRTETLHGAHPEDDEDMASCPVCKECPREDDRWVKCDGCGSWYHQICVLFNEIAHGKSVRFFCRTPGCRKRGSRQLNRRQRKPSYPTSPSIESCSLAEKMSAMVQPVARPDRDVVIKVVASVELQREAKGNRSSKKLVERVRNKTICAFQHTLIGSDLLFLIMFVEEIVGADGVGRVEIRHVSSNGMYEQSQPNEAVNVESAIIQSYLHHVAAAGFASTRIHVGTHDLFYGAPPSVQPSATESLPLCVQLLADARRIGIVHSFQQERNDGNQEVVRAMLVAPGTMLRGVAPERDADVVCPIAQTPQDWLQVQEQHGYKFDDLQFAKFSSMMLVYHLIKGWTKEFTAPRYVSAPSYDTATSTASRQSSKHLSSPSLSPSPKAGPSSPNMYPVPALTPAQGGLPMAQPMRQGAGGYGGAAQGSYMSSYRAADDSSHLERFANDLSLPRDVRQMLQMTVGSGHGRQMIPTGSSGMAQDQAMLCNMVDTGAIIDSNPQPLERSSPVLQSIVPGGAGQQDAFWSDTLFSELAEESSESPFWDCFFSSLD